MNTQHSLETLLKQLSIKNLLEVYNRFSSIKVKKFSTQPTALSRTVQLLETKKITPDILISRFKTLIPVPKTTAPAANNDSTNEFGNLEENGKAPIPGRRLLVFLATFGKAPTFEDIYEVIPLDKDVLKERIDQWIHMDFIRCYTTVVGNRRQVQTYQLGQKGSEWLKEKGEAAKAHVAKYPWKRSEQPQQEDKKQKQIENLQKARAAKGNTKTTRTSVSLDAKIQMLVKENPRRAGTITWNSFNKIKQGMTVDAYLAAGGRMVDLKWDIEHGHLSLK